MSKRVYKYGTGQEIPEGAIYLSTQVEEKINYLVLPTSGYSGDVPKIRLVWHYFLVEVKK
jgi:hypothetical protein